MWLGHRFAISKGEGNPNHAADGRFASAPGAAGDKVRTTLAALPTRPESQNWLDPYHTDAYTKDRREVNLKDMQHLGIKQDTNADIRYVSQPTYEKTGLQDVPTEKITFSGLQPSVNAEKVANLADNYHPDPASFNRSGDIRPGGEAPAFTLMPDGSYMTSDHHRPTASILRGDTTLVGRVTTYAQQNDGRYKQVTTKATYK